jgi:hypothetical protein
MWRQVRNDDHNDDRNHHNDSRFVHVTPSDTLFVGALYR